MNSSASGSGPRASVLITDLDNTLWNWLDIWHSYFKPMHDGLVRKLGVSEAVLRAEIKTIHEKYRTSEYTFLIQELPSVIQKYGPDVDVYQHFSDVIQAAQEGRKSASVLYPTVFATLKEIRSKGTRIIGFTESQAFHASQRIRTLGLDGLIDILYTTIDRGTPTNEKLQSLRKKEAAYYELRQTQLKALPTDAVKPSPAILSMMISDIDARPSEVIYVGDNLFKDVRMANDIGIRSVHAEYGESHNHLQYELLKEVTHWPEQDVMTEQATNKASTCPSYELKTSFSELLTIFTFEPFVVPPRLAEHELSLLDRKLELWKIAVGTQQHFNTLQLQLRNFSLTLYLAILTGAGYVIKQHISLTIHGFTFCAALPVSITGCVAIFVFYYMDWGYHRLLKGAVDKGSQIEAAIKIFLPEAGLAETITRESSSKKFLWLLPTNSTLRLHTFYLVLMGVLILIGVGSFCLPLDNAAPAAPPSNASSNASPQSPSILPKPSAPITAGSQVPVTNGQNSSTLLPTASQAPAAQSTQSPPVRQVSHPSTNTLNPASP